MYNFSKKIYNQLSGHLLELIVSSSFLYATFNIETEQTLIKFSSTLFPQLEKIDYPEGHCFVVVDLIPVWWSVRTFSGGEELLNDFDFNKLKASLCHR
ncbi:MAG: hypothetical protein SNG35_05330 [Rikenellaceae bacterium]